MNIEFEIKDTSRDFVVIRKDFPYSFHAHIRCKQTCYTLLKLIELNKLPDSEYLRGSCKRLLTEEEYQILKPKKQKYININHGIKNKRIG